jgi:hypothetical protein
VRSLCMLTARRFCITSTSSTLAPTPTTDEVRDSADHARRYPRMSVSLW